MNRNRIKDGILKSLIDCLIEDDNFWYDVCIANGWDANFACSEDFISAVPELIQELEKLAESWTA